MRNDRFVKVVVWLVVIAMVLTLIAFATSKYWVFYSGDKRG